MQHDHCKGSGYTGQHFWANLQRTCLYPLTSRIFFQKIETSITSCFWRRMFQLKHNSSVWIVRLGTLRQRLSKRLHFASIQLASMRARIVVSWMVSWDMGLFQRADYQTWSFPFRMTFTDYLVPLSVNLLVKSGVHFTPYPMLLPNTHRDKKAKGNPSFSRSQLRFHEMNFTSYWHFKTFSLNLSMLGCTKWPVVDLCSTEF